MFLAMSLTTGGDNESLDSFAMRENITVAEDDMSSSSHLQGFEQVSEGSLIGVVFVFGGNSSVGLNMRVSEVW